MNRKITQQRQAQARSFNLGNFDESGAPINRVPLVNPLAEEQEASKLQKIKYGIIATASAITLIVLILIFSGKKQ